MKKWQTVVLALLPITLLMIYLNVDIDFKAIGSEKKLNTAIEGYLEMDNYRYDLTFILNQDDMTMHVINSVEVNEMPLDDWREFHKVMVTYTEGQETHEESIAYILDPSIENTVLIQEHPEEQWEAYTIGEVFDVQLSVAQQISQVLAGNRNQREFIDKDDEFLYYRIYESPIVDQDWFDIIPERVKTHIISTSVGRDYFIDIKVQDRSSEIVAIDLDGSTISVYLTVMNGFQTSEDNGDYSFPTMNYRIDHINGVTETFALPNYSNTMD